MFYSKGILILLIIFTHFYFFNTVFLFQTLRSVLDHRGFGHVDIVAPDGGWGISTDMWKDQALMEAVYAIG